MKIKMKSKPSFLGSNELDIEVNAGRPTSPNLWTFPYTGEEEYVLELQKQVVELTERVRALEKAVGKAFQNFGPSDPKGTP